MIVYNYICMCTYHDIFLTLLLFCICWMYWHLTYHLIVIFQMLWVLSFHLHNSSLMQVLLLFQNLKTLSILATPVLWASSRSHCMYPHCSAGVALTLLPPPCLLRSPWCWGQSSESAFWVPSSCLFVKAMREQVRPCSFHLAGASELVLTGQIGLHISACTLT